MKTFIAIAAFTLCQGAAAQAYKCVDASGRVLYSGQPCNELGLKDAGEVRDRLQITPAPPRSAAPSRPAASPPQAEAPTKPAASEEPPKPERRCFTVTLKGGKTATRCNDKPDEDPQ